MNENKLLNNVTDTRNFFLEVANPVGIGYLARSVAASSLGHDLRASTAFTPKMVATELAGVAAAFACHRYFRHQDSPESYIQPSPPPPPATWVADSPEYLGRLGLAGPEAKRSA